MFLHGSGSLVQITKPASYWGLDWSLRPHLQSPAYLNCSLVQNWQHHLSTLNKHIELSVDASLITIISISIPWVSVLLFVGRACCQGGTMERCRVHLAPHSEECSSGVTVNCKFFFWRTPWDVSYFHCCRFELAIRGLWHYVVTHLPTYWIGAQVTVQWLYMCMSHQQKLTMSYMTLTSLPLWYDLLSVYFKARDMAFSSQQCFYYY